MWTIGVITSIHYTSIGVRINSQLSSDFEMVQFDSSFKIDEIIGVELDDSFATSDDGKSIWNHRTMYVKSKELQVINICHYSRLRFMINNNLCKLHRFHSLYRYSSGITDRSQDYLEDIANILSRSNGSAISKMIERDGVSRILREDLLFSVLDNDPNIEWLLRDYIHHQKIGNYTGCKNIQDRRIDINSSIKIVETCAIYNTDKYITITNNSGFPDNYLNKLFRIKINVKEYFDFSVNDEEDPYPFYEWNTPFCATLDIDRDSLLSNTNEVIKSIADLLRETNDLALKKYSYDDHLHYLMNECRHVKYLYNCRKKQLFDSLVIKASGGFVDQGYRPVYGYWNEKDYYDVSDINSFSVQ